MAIDLEAQDETLYEEGFNDGFDGYSPRNEDPAYIEGFWDGVREAEWQEDDEDFGFADYDD